MDNLNKIYKIISEFLIKNGAKEISVFGSYSRNEFNQDSDIDLLVEFSSRKSLLDIVGIEQELSDILGIRVDLQTKKSISPYLINKIINDRIIIYQ